jgi:hypothetical protein
MCSIKEGSFCLCHECDHVFHKSVIRRGHFRLPIDIEGSLLHVMQLIDPQLQSSIRLGTQCDKIMIHKDPGHTILASCLVLHAIRGLVDDRRSREQSIPSVLLEPLLMTQRALLMASAHSHNLTYTTLDTASVDFAYMISRLVDYRDDIYVSPGENIDVDEPPESTHSCLLRMAYMLMTQITSRFFLLETVKSIEWVEAASPFDTVNMQLPKRKCDVLCNRAEIALRVSTFRKCGGDAMIVFILTDSSLRIPLTLPDKQYCIWLLREIIVSAMDSDPLLSYPNICWLAWLLNCPVSPNDSHIPSIQIPYPLESEPKGLVYAPLPVAKPQISAEIRCFVAQEFRLLLGGDDWVSCLPPEHTHIPNRNLFIPWVRSISTDNLNDDSRSRDTFDVQGRSSINYLAYPFRIPISNDIVKVRIVHIF